MRRDNRYRWILVIVLVFIAGYYLIPTVRYYSLSSEEKHDPTHVQQTAELERKAIKRGLDLQGGIHMQMEIKLPSLLNNLATNKDEVFDNMLNEAIARTESGNQDLLSNFEAIAKSRDIRLERYFERERRLDENNNVLEVMDYLRNQSDESIQQSLNILRNRIDQFGVAEPNIYKQGNRRIVIELPGLENIDLAKELIGQTANLEFRLEKPPTVYNDVFEALDRVLKKEAPDSAALAAASAEEDSAAAEQKPGTATEMNIAELFGETDSTAQAADSSETAVVDLNTFGERPFQSLLTGFNEQFITAIEKNVPIIEAILKRDEIKSVIPGDSEFLWGAEPLVNQGENYYQLYLLKKDAELGGEVITDARVVIGSGYDPSTSGKPTVTMEMNREGGSKWSRITGANINKRIAIVLDGKVLSAPTVQNKIANGRSSITGSFTMDEAKNLAINLRTGSFRADMEIIAEQTVGPSLGVDSIRNSTWAALIGLIVVAIFMIIYYRFSGFIANIALVLNLYFIMAVLAGFHATLTLPGIAGLILTIGMAVDANVLIFERIREELLTGKTVRAAIDSGYSRAFFTILDANITTLITAVILYQYGTGAIKGFALTLSIGIITSMFTAIIVTRLVFDFFAGRKQVQELSI